MISLDHDDLKDRIDRLRSGYEGYSTSLRERNKNFLRLFSPEWDAHLREYDQWGTPLTAADVGKTRASFNIVKPTVELWTALEAYPLPTPKWIEQFIPPAVPVMDEQQNDMRQQIRRAQKLVSRQMATLREQALIKHIRAGRLDRHYYRTILRKNLFGHSWLQVLPDKKRKRFTFRSNFDPSTVYPVWSMSDQSDLAAILVVTRRAARPMSEQYPDAVKLTEDGDVVGGSNYQSTHVDVADAGRGWIWVEDYWVLDEKWEQEVRDSEPVRSRVINAIRVNGKIVETHEYPGWQSLPYFQFENDNLRDRTGFSDAGNAGPFQDGINRFMSTQEDVIGGEGRPKWKYRSDGGSQKEVKLSEEGIIHLDADEDIEQLRAIIDVFPTQVLGQQLMDYYSFSTGLNDSVRGKIVASQNSGRALAWAHKSVAARMVPRLQADAASLDRAGTFMLDVMELYNWDGARDLYNGNRDYEWEFPNQEPRDFAEQMAVAINAQNAKLVDNMGAMEMTGEKSPDEMQERVRADLTDPILHPDAAQAYQLLQFQAEENERRKQQAAQQQQVNMAEQQAAAEQARTEAAQRAAPTPPPGTPQPATAAGQPANATQTQASTLVQNGRLIGNRIIQKTNY